MKLHSQSTVARLCALASVLAVFTLALHAQDNTGDAAADANKAISSQLSSSESVAFSAAVNPDNAAHLTITVDASHLPSPVPDKVTLDFVSANGFVWWSGPVESAANGDSVSYSTDLPPSGVAAVLVAPAIKLTFPATSAGGKATEITIPRDRLREQLAHVTPDMHGQPFFFSPPAPEAAPAAPAADAPREVVSSYIEKIERWDNDFQSSIFGFDNQLSHSKTLWEDLHTAGRLPWSESVIAQYTQLYNQVDGARETLLQTQSSARAAAKAFVSQWNQAHPAQNGLLPLHVSFFAGASSN